MANNLSGKWKMNNISDCFNIGSIVACRTCYHKEIEGEVLAFDSHSKMLILKCSASDGNPALCDVDFVNLNFVSDVQVVKEVSSAPPTPHSLDTDSLTNRLKNNVNNKRRLITALQSGVPPEGQKLYFTITKTIDDVKWDGPDIVVLGQVRITPPYKPENVIGNADNKAYIHLRKLVEKYTKDIQSGKKEIQTSNNNNNNSSSSNVCVSSTSNSSSNHNNCAAPLPQ